MKIFKSKILIAALFIIASVGLYIAHYLLFHDAHHILIYLVGDIAFLPAEVLLVTMVFHALLESREKKHKLNKLNMVIGTFFCEAGTDLVSMLAQNDADISILQNRLNVQNNWTEKDFTHANKFIRNYTYNAQIKGDDLAILRDTLLCKRDFFVSLLNNPNLLEHDRFTDLLWAIFHLTEELSHRKQPADVSGQDQVHIQIDINRAYAALVKEWIQYMQHLKKSYPYLYSLAVRTNPFNPAANAIVAD